MRTRIVAGFALALVAACAAPTQETRPTTPPSATRAAASRSVAQNPASQQRPSDFAGRWTTTYGPMRLTRDGARVSGTYGAGGTPSLIDGRAQDGKLVFRYTEHDVAGEGWFEIAADGDSFSGRWRPDGSQHWSEWTGQREVAPVDAATFAGAWRSTYGTLRIALDGERATGRYAYGAGGTIEGVLDGRTLRVAYTEPGDVAGRARFELAADGASFRGVWKQGARDDADLDGPGTSSWSGARIVPVPGRTWLVVLEAYWQADLHEPDYSYGEMLGAYFERLPDVAFRQRFFGGREDFVRLARECEALEEPVVLYVSSHGAPDGIASPGGILDGETFGAALANVPNLKLLHLGACSGLAGDLPREIRAAAGTGARFPVSGFRRNVDWAGSALVDFTYLDLVLGRGIEPEAAVAETRRLVTFAGDTVPDGAAIPATELSIDVASQP